MLVWERNIRGVFSVKYAYKVLNRAWTTLWALALEARTEDEVTIQGGLVLLVSGETGCFNT